MALIHVLLAALRCHYCTMSLCWSQSLCCWSPPDQFGWYPSAETDWIVAHTPWFMFLGGIRTAGAINTCPQNMQCIPISLYRISGEWTVGNPSISKRLPCSFISVDVKSHACRQTGNMLSAHLSPSLLPFLSLRWLIVQIIPSATICVR